MCHLILILPLAALAVFWITPLPVALAIYGPTLAVSLWIYWWVMKTMRRPVQTGREEMLHAAGRVVDAGSGSLRVRAHGELWKAVCAEPLQKDDEVEVIALEGLVLRVRRIASPTRRGGI